MSRQRALALTGSVVGAVVVALDGTVLSVVQPTLRRDLHASFAQVQWTSTGYLIAVAGLLVFSGRLGDRYGHQRLFGTGMLGFGAASAGIGLAPGIGWVIALRVVQGVFGALLQPATLAMLRAAFPPDRLRMPIAVRTSAIGLAAATGPVLGGALVAGPGWRAAFFLNVVPTLTLGALALASRGGTGRPHGAGLGAPSPRRAHRTGPDTLSPRPAVSLDLPGALLLALALAGLVQALVGLPERGWTPASGAGAAVALATGAVFVRHERRAASPLVPPDLVGSAGVGRAVGVLVMASAALQGTLFTATFLLQNALGVGPLRMALLSLPLAALMILAAPCCAVLLRRFGARRTTVTAMAVLAAGIVVLDRATGTLAFCAGFGLLGAGFGTVMVAATHVVVREAAVESAGVAGGLKQTAMNVGPVLGVAVATTLMGSHAGGARLPLIVLAAVAAVGAVLAGSLPERCALMINPGQPGDRSGVPARR
ncbi:MFS transporter [Streptomyces sp. SLBN-31]|uniref:MFS transporter n=1 Tax=Streptomyces sp. SLBN-31 TaxID=2768444 RepID=UPI0011534BFB|nr:MFS transporter [Streptomyces sp. SLBN-31]TQJ91142.1 MFS transporter [Streptomyces sp. SLBN-31]